MANENDNVALQFRRYGSNKETLLKFPGNGGICLGYSYKSLNPLYSSPYLTGVVGFKGDWAYLSEFKNHYRHLLGFNINTGEYWCKKLASGSTFTFPNFSIDSQGNLFVSNGVLGTSMTGTQSFYPQHGVFELFKLDGLGNVKWKKGLIVRDSPQGDTMHIETRCLTLDAENNVYISGKLYGNPLGFFGQFIAKLDSSGNPI